MKISRRQVLLGSSLLVPVSSTLSAILPPKSDYVFAHGLASGDPASDSVVIWTRISGAKEEIKVDWYVAQDADFTHIVSKGSLLTSEEKDYTVKAIADGLEAGQIYYYQFVSNGVTSLVGRTRTLPSGHVEKLGLAVATCSNYPFGHFNAYEAIAMDESVDVVVHLGDYIYEYGADGYGGGVGREIGRVHEPHHELLSLNDYRQRHAQYKGDIGSQKMHAQHPLVVIWDDHESANNPWMHGAQNHQLDEGSWQDRREASLRAYFEWMPIRDPIKGVSYQEYWRHYKFGDLLSLITLESRHTGRSKQIEYKEYLKELKDKEEAKDFYESVVSAPERQMLSEGMKRFLKSELSESVKANRKWRVIGNQSIMAKAVTPEVDLPVFTKLIANVNVWTQGMFKALKRLGQLDLPGDLDAWDGYPAGREDFYTISKNAGAQDLLVISGDSHSFWANSLFNDNDEAMGLELGASGISSPRSLLSFGEEGMKVFDKLNMSRNKEIEWADGRYRGYIRLTLTHKKAHADFIAVSNVKTRQYDLKTIHQVDIQNVNGRLQYLS